MSNVVWCMGMRMDIVGHTRYVNFQLASHCAYLFRLCTPKKTVMLAWIVKRLNYLLFVEPLQDPVLSWRSQELLPSSLHSTAGRHDLWNIQGSITIQINISLLPALRDPLRIFWSWYSFTAEDNCKSWLELYLNKRNHIKWHHSRRVTEMMICSSCSGVRTGNVLTSLYQIQLMVSGARGRALEPLATGHVVWASRIALEPAPTRRKFRCST